MIAMKRQCCVCFKVWHEDASGRGAWLESAGRLRSATHTYCPECLAELRRDIQRVVGARKRSALVAAG
jgi:hypothetical protein